MINRRWMLFIVAVLLRCSALGATVTTLDGKRYEGEACLQPGNIVSVVLRDSSKRSIPLDHVKSATFGSAQLSMANFGHIAEGWTNIDIGDVTIAGTAGQSNTLFAVRIGSGHIDDRADSFHYVYTPARGDVDLVARIVSISGADHLARAGVMFRDSLRPESKFAFAGITATGEAALQHRSDTGGRAIRAAPVALNLPLWLKLTRREKNFAAYTSDDGKDWRQLGLASLAFKDNCFVGLAVSSHSALSFCTALIDGVSRTITGVHAEYFADFNFTKVLTNRIDPMINFAWDGMSPLEGAPATKYSIRWTGEFEPKFSENYTFYAHPGDARLWVKDQEVALPPFHGNYPTFRQTEVTNSPPLLLKAGNRYPFRFEFRHIGGRLPVMLGWSSQSQRHEPIPARRLFCVVDARAQPGPRAALTNQWTMGRGILLRNGTFLAGAVRSITADGVKFLYREKEYIVASHQVARAVFRISPRNAMLNNPELPAGALLGNGDFIEGRLQFGRGRDVKVSSVLFGLKSYNLDNSDIAALSLGGPSASGARYEVRLADNSILMANFVSVAQDQVSIAESLLGTLQVPRDAVTELRGFQPRATTR